MKIGIDISHLNKLNKTRGIGFYTQNLVESLRKNTDLEVTLIEDEAKRENFDLIHYPYYDFFETTLSPEKNIPTVVTVHDVIPLVFPTHYPPGIRGKLKSYKQKRALKKVGAVITDSNASKRDIEKYLGIDQSRIHVVYLAASNDFKKITDKNLLNSVRNKYILPEKFILFTGNNNWNKNLINLTQAAVNAEMDIVFVGKGFENKENLNHSELAPFKEFLEKFENNPLIHMLGFVESKDAVAIYNLAQALMLPSFYEGFGLTILEAQKCGTPVITSNNSSMVEVAGDGAVLVDPEKVTEIQNAIKRVTSDERLRKELTQKGFENANKFTWKKTAEETMKVYVKTLK